MIARIEKGRIHFDVFCPSDYIIEHTLASDLLLSITRASKARRKKSRRRK